MPAALEVDHEQVRIVALAIGVREAARQFGLTEDCVRTWSSREGWLKDQRESDLQTESLLAQKRERQGLSPTATANASDILKEFGHETRLSHAKVARKIGKKLENVDEDELLMQMPNVLSAAKHASVVFAWSGTSTGASLRLDLLASTIDLRLDGPTPEQQDIPD